jgi:dTDP-4-dehydrorhamnose reductase
VSWYEFAEAIMDIAHRWKKVKTNRVEPILTADYPTKARRPAFSALDCNLIEKNFGINPIPWRHSLKSAIRRLCKKNGSC